MLAKAPGGLAAGTEYAKGQCPTEGDVLSAAAYSLLGDVAAQTALSELGQGNMGAASKAFSTFYGMGWADIMQSWGEELSFGATPQDGLMPYMPQDN